MAEKTKYNAFFLRRTRGPSTILSDKLKLNCLTSTQKICSAHDVEAAEAPTYQWTDAATLLNTTEPLLETIPKNSHIK